MSVRYICDKCGDVMPVHGLFRIIVDPSLDGEEMTRSKLDLCESCARKILRDANTPDPKPAEDGGF